MKKSDRIRDLVQGLVPQPTDGQDPRYTGFFACFNDQRYYEAHDVLEDLWLGDRGPNHAFYKGLIQLAGAFVHLQKQFLRPTHPKDGRRLHPASRLFQLASRNLSPYAPNHLGLDVSWVLSLITEHTTALSASDYTRNPWQPDHAPQIQIA